MHHVSHLVQLRSLQWGPFSAPQCTFSHHTACHQPLLTGAYDGRHSEKTSGGRRNGRCSARNELARRSVVRFRLSCTDVNRRPRRVSLQKAIHLGHPIANGSQLPRDKFIVKQRASHHQTVRARLSQFGRRAVRNGRSDGSAARCKRLKSYVKKRSRPVVSELSRSSGAVFTPAPSGVRAYIAARRFTALLFDCSRLAGIARCCKPGGVRNALP